MKKIIFLSTFIILLSLVALAQPALSIKWQHSFGGSQNDFGSALKQTSDGGYIIAGTTYSNNFDVTGNHGAADFLILKIDNSGNVQWQKSLGSSGYEIANSIEQTNDGGYIVAGSSDFNDGDVTVNHGFRDYWIVKLTGSGTIEWEKSLGGSELDEANSVKQTFDGGYIVAGYSQSVDGDVHNHHGTRQVSDYWIVKLSNTGTLEWEKSFGGFDDDRAQAIFQTSDSGFIISGFSNSFEGDVSGQHGIIGTYTNDVWVVKLNKQANIEWQKSFGGTLDDFAYALAQTYDGGYIVAGTANSNDGDLSNLHIGKTDSTDIWVIKLTSMGDIEWQKDLGGSGNDVAYLNSVQQNKDSTFVIAGHTNSTDSTLSTNHGMYDFSIFKLSKSGDILWQKNIGGSQIEAYSAVTVTSSGDYLIGGYSQSNDGDVTGNHGNYDAWIVDLQEKINMSYKFIGSGNWTELSNWESGLVPPSIVLSGTTIFIEAGSNCVLNTSVTLNKGSSLTVSPSANLSILGNLTIVNN